MQAMKLVTKLGIEGKQIGVHWLFTMPRVGDHIVGPDSKVWKVEAVGHYSHLQERAPEGPIGELAVTEG